MKNSIIKTTGSYTDPAWENVINSKHQEYLKTSILWGATCAIQGTVKDDTNLSVLTETIYRNYDTLISSSHKHIDGVLGIAQAKLEIDKLNAENEVLEPESITLEKQYQIEKNRVGHVEVPMVPYRQIMFASLIGLLILLFDAYFLGTAFQSTGSGLLLSLILGFIISATIAVVSILGSWQIEKIENRGKRIIAYIGLALFISAAVYVLCEMRSWYFHTQTGQHMSPIKLMLLNLLAFVGFHLIYKRLLAPAFQIIKERRLATQKLARLNQLKVEWEKVKNTIYSNLQKIVDIKQFRLAVLSYAKSLENTISKYYRESIAEFKKSFIERSGFVPNSFKTEAPDLTHYYEEYSITPKIHENTTQPN
jgi:hypothetical protein